MVIDPVRYEMYFHRLWAIGEEGRMTLQRVTASPIVSQDRKSTRLNSSHSAKSRMPSSA